jgi:hypothetical protein
MFCAWGSPVFVAAALGAWLVIQALSHRSDSKPTPSDSRPVTAGPDGFRCPECGAPKTPGMFCVKCSKTG